MPIQRVYHLMIGQQSGLPANTFIFTVKTAGVDETFTLPLEADGTYNFDVDWGDTNSDTLTLWDDAAKTHTYANAGMHEIQITGTLIGFRFYNDGDKLKIYEIKAWGILRLGNNNGYFYGCKYLSVTATDILDLTGTTDLSFMFRDTYYNLTTIPSINDWDISNVTTLRLMFCRAYVFNSPLGSWNTSNVLSLYQTFNRAYAFDQPLNSWDVSKVTTLYGTFGNALVFNQPLNSWDVSNVTIMYQSFSGAAAFNQNINSWDTSKVTDMTGMFSGASAFDQPLNSWVITNVTTMDSMFWNITLSTANYSAILIGWEAQAVQNNVSFHGGDSKYSAGAAATARADLIADHTWDIEDGGQA